MEKKPTTEVPKGCTTSFSILIILIVIFIAVKCISGMMPTAQYRDYSKEWATMTYEQKDSLLKKAIEKRSFYNAEEIEQAMREAIQKEIRNPGTISYKLNPSVYNGFANVVEADSGWIYVPFKLSAKNDFGIRKEATGSVMYIYDPSSNSLNVKHWDINFNDD
jgi:hypothetical protein